MPLKMPPALFDYLGAAARERASRAAFKSAAQAWRLVRADGGSKAELAERAMERARRQSFDAYVAAMPPWFRSDTGWPKMKNADQIDLAIEFLEHDPWFNESGYFKEHLATRLKQVALTPTQIERLRAVVLKALTGKNRREFRDYWRLARKLDGDELRTGIEEISKQLDPTTRRHVSRLLRVLNQGGTPPKAWP